MCDLFRTNVIAGLSQERDSRLMAKQKKGWLNSRYFRPEWGTVKMEEARGPGIHLERCTVRMEEETVTRAFSRRYKDKETDCLLEPTWRASLADTLDSEFWAQQLNNVLHHWACGCLSQLQWGSYSITLCFARARCFLCEMADYRPGSPAMCLLLVYEVPFHECSSSPWSASTLLHPNKCVASRGLTVNTPGMVLAKNNLWQSRNQAKIPIKRKLRESFHEVFKVKYVSVSLCHLFQRCWQR